MFSSPSSSSRSGWLGGLLLAWLAGVLAASAQVDGSLRWRFSTLSTSAAGNILSSPASAADGTIYIGVEVGSASGTTAGGHLFAIRPDGALRWSFPTTDWVDSAPAVAPDGTIYFGCWNGNLYALNPDGTPKWVAAAGDFVASSPAVGADGTIYVGSGSSNLYAFNPSGALKWTFPAGDWIDSSPAIGADGTIYFGSWDNHVYAVRPDGSEKWRYATGLSVVGSPAIAADGTVYIGSRDKVLHALTPFGVRKWSIDLLDPIDASPVIGSDGTVYVGTIGGRLFALDRDGNERWRYPAADQAALSAIYSTPAIRADGTIIFGTGDNALVALRADGTLLWQAAMDDVADSSPLIAADGTIYIGCADKRLYSFSGNGQPRAPDSPWPAFRRTSANHGRTAAVDVAIAPAQLAPAPGDSPSLAATATTTEGAAPALEWQRNGAVVAGAVDSVLPLTGVTPATTGVYTAVARNALTAGASFPAIVGLATAAKITGDGFEIGPDINHPNGTTYDQILLQGQAATLTADPGQVTRMSYIDLSDDIVQVEFSGAGTLSLSLAAVEGPAPPAIYEQPNVAYVKGHASIVITGADDTTNVTVFTVGKMTALNQSLFKPDVDYDGVADLAFIAIASPAGKFGGLRAANVNFLATRGITGVYAPGIAFQGPVYVGDITAADDAVPMLIVGSTNEAAITGGSLLQSNNRPVLVGGLSQLKFVNGTTSHGTLVPAQANAAQFESGNTQVVLE